MLIQRYSHYIIEWGFLMIIKVVHDIFHITTIKGWQSGWFYITEPRDTNWVVAPKFRPGIPTRLTSSKEKGLSWGSSVELTGLQNCVKNMIRKKIKLVNVVQVMLFRRILPCQRRAFNLWEFDPAEHQTLRRLFDTTHKDVWKVLFKGAEVPPSLAEDRGLSAKRLARSVSSIRPVGHLFSLA